MLLHHERPRFADRRDSPALREFVFGHDDPVDAPEPIRCPHCGGTGVIPIFGGHGYAAIPTECLACEGEGEVDPREIA